VYDDSLRDGSTPPAEIKRARENARGGRRLLSFENLAARFHHSGVILERRLDEPIDDVTPRCSVEFGPLGRSDIEEFLRFHPDRRREFIERRFSTGDLCFAARHEGALASTTWACRSKHWVPDLHFMWHVAPGEVYLYDSYTAPQLRERGLFAALGTHVLRYFRSLDVERVLTTIAPENTASLRSRAKVGFRPCGDIRCFSIGWGVHLHRRRRFASSSTIAARRR
jgi:RimJ/RimL family protein N-acetyltransferase